MTHFTRKLSQRLREMGVDRKTMIMWCCPPRNEPVWELRFFMESHSSHDFFDKTFPAYTLQDLLLLMPQVGEKMGWRNDDGTPYVNSELQDMIEMLFYAFMSGIDDGTHMQKAEAYFMSITEKKV